MRAPTTLTFIAISALLGATTAAHAANPVTPATKPAQPAAKPASKPIAPAADISTPARRTAPAAPAANAVAASKALVREGVLWDYWYTVTVNKVVHYEYYNDHAEIKKGRVIFQNRAWKQEEDFINEEQLGAFSNNDASLTPLFFNFHSSYRSVETNIDGSIAAQSGGGRLLSVRIRKGSRELPLIKKMVPPKTLFSLHFPIWLGRNIAAFKPGQVYPFQTILEDNLESEFMTVPGQVRVEPADTLAAQTHTIKLTVNYHEMKSTWWVDSMGAPMRIEMPLQKTVVQRVPKEAAVKFLEESS
jgi:hypothetical protein